MKESNSEHSLANDRFSTKPTLELEMFIMFFRAIIYIMEFKRVLTILFNTYSIPLQILTFLDPLLGILKLCQRGALSRIQIFYHKICCLHRF